MNDQTRIKRSRLRKSKIAYDDFVKKYFMRKLLMALWESVFDFWASQKYKMI